MNQDTPQVDVIVIGFRGKRWLPACLESLESAGRQLRLVLVDNGGENDIESLDLSHLDHVVIQTPKALGFAEANNFALQQGPPSAPFVCFLNQDTISEPNWIDHCLQCFAQHSKVGALTPQLQTYDGAGYDPGFKDCCVDHPQLSNDLQSGLFSLDYYPTRYVTAAAVIVRSEVLRQVGPFDPVFGSYYEDYDLCRRIRQASYEVGVASQGIVRHYSGSSTTTKQAERKRMRQILRNRALLRIRESGESRKLRLLKQFLVQFPHGIARGLLRTPSSQPPIVQIAAHWDLMKLGNRLASPARDQMLWESYLDRIGWRKTGGMESVSTTMESSPLG